MADSGSLITATRGVWLKLFIKVALVQITSTFNARDPRCISSRPVNSKKLDTMPYLNLWYHELNWKHMVCSNEAEFQSSGRLQDKATLALNCPKLVYGAFWRLSINGVATMFTRYAHLSIYETQWRSLFAHKIQHLQISGTFGQLLRQHGSSSLEVFWHLVELIPCQFLHLAGIEQFLFNINIYFMIFGIFKKIKNI